MSDAAPQLGVHLCLFYDYVEDVVEKRAPLRADHLALAREWKADGRIVMAGALGNPRTARCSSFASRIPRRSRRSWPPIRTCRAPS